MNEQHKMVKAENGILALARSEPSKPHVPDLPPAGYVEEAYDEDGLRLRDYWRAVRKRLWLIIGISLLATVLAAVYLARKPDIYEAQARVQVDLENNNPGVGSPKGGPVVVNNPVYDPAYFNTQLQVLTGGGLLRRVAKTLDLEHNAAFRQPQSLQSRSTWQSLLHMAGLGRKDEEKSSAPSDELLTHTVAAATSREDLGEAKRLAPYVLSLQEGLKVEPVKETRLSYRETRLIDVSFDHPDPQVAAKVVNAVADTFVLSNLEKKTETNNSTGDFLQKRIAELQAQIRNGEEKLLNYAKNNQILSLDAGQNTVVERLAGLNKQLLEAENEREMAEAAYRVSLTPGAAAAQAESETKQIAEAESKLNELKQKRAQLLVENTEEWPEVKEVNQQIAALEKQLQDARTQATSVVLTNLETRYKQALAREQALRDAFNQQRGETLTQNQAAINYRIIQQEIETNKTLLDGLLQRSKENDVILAGTPNNIYVVDYAIAPDKPVGPKRLRGVLLAFLLSLTLGVGLALFLDYLDDSVHSIDEVETLLRLPAIAVIPSAAAVKTRRLAAGRGDKALASNGNAQAGREVLISADARSPLAEAYRQLRTSVLLSTAGHAPQTLLVASSVPSEGKTTTAVNTAISLAQTGVRVLIVDADMRRPRLHSIFSLGNGRGLSTILSSAMSEAEINAMIQHDEASNLYVLTAGPVPPNPAELIGSQQMRSLIAALKPTFTHIVIDSPPVASFTDSVLLSTMVDGVLLVVQAGKTSRNVVRRTRQFLQEVGAKIFGVVLNKANADSHDYYYHEYYQQAYYDVDANASQASSN
jgi:capsular exopolysaccharide synthesis family protein